jgi:hypothetical protein
MTKNKCNDPNKADLDSSFWIFRVWNLFWPRFVSIRGASFVLRISDLFRQVLGTMTFFVTSFGAENIRDEFSDFGV